MSVTRSHPSDELQTAFLEIDEHLADWLNLGIDKTVTRADCSKILDAHKDNDDAETSGSVISLMNDFSKTNAARDNTLSSLGLMGVSHLRAATSGASELSSESDTMAVEEVSAIASQAETFVNSPR